MPNCAIYCPSGFHHEAPMLLRSKSNRRTLGRLLTRCVIAFPLTPSVAAHVAKSKSATLVDLLAFDFAPLRPSGTATHYR